MDGSAIIDINRWNSASDYNMTIQLVALTGSEGGISYGPYNYSGNIDETNGVVSYTYSGSDWTVMGDPVVTSNGTTATITSGTVRVNYASSGWVRVNTSNWVFDVNTGIAANGSTMTITASNGTSALVTATGGGHYTVAITVGGATNSYYF